MKTQTRTSIKIALGFSHQYTLNEINAEAGQTLKVVYNSPPNSALESQDAIWQLREEKTGFYFSSDVHGRVHFILPF